MPNLTDTQALREALADRLTERTKAGHGRIIGIKEEALASRLYKGEALLYFAASDRLADFEDALPSLLTALDDLTARAERSVELPCKVGDTIVLHGEKRYTFMGIVQQPGYLPVLYGRQQFGAHQDVPIALVESWGTGVLPFRADAQAAMTTGKGVEG